MVHLRAPYAARICVEQRGAGGLPDSITRRSELPSTALAVAARRLGFGAHWSLPVPAYSGSMAPPTPQTDCAADAIGQGRVLASPLVMALMASAADGGKVLPPTLTVTDSPGRSTTPPTSLTRKMHTLMSATVSLPAGTAHALAALAMSTERPAPPSTGMRRLRAATPGSPAYAGDLAFAVFVYDGDEQWQRSAGRARLPNRPAMTGQTATLMPRA